MNAWFTVSNEAEVPSPALLLYHERIEANLQTMLLLAGDPRRLWPHVKTHKLAPLVRRQVELGIVRCKCATIAEAEMVAGAGAHEVLLAQQPVGPNVARLIALAALFPETEFSTIVDDLSALRALGVAAVQAGRQVPVLLDLDVGMGRTGVPPGAQAFALYRELAVMPGIQAGGLHAYDGHLHQTDLAARTAAWEQAFAPVWALHAALQQAGLPVLRLIGGGTPTFPLHAAHAGIECSPGTSVLWDAGYGTRLPDLPFITSAALLTRVLSKPRRDRLCLDLGHKSVASEMPHPRAIFPALPEAVTVMHSEEHLVIETPQAEAIPVGAALYAIPWHVCPTVALHAEAWLVRAGRAEERWPILARARRITV